MTNGTLTNLRRPGRLKAIAAERGKPLEVLIPELIEQEGGIEAAARNLRVSKNTVAFWLKKHNLEVTTYTVAVVSQKVTA